MTALAERREVTKVIPSHEAMAHSMPRSIPCEVRERRDGSWSVLYPDPGFIPCAPVCYFGQKGWPFPGHKHEYAPKMIETEYKPTSFDDAKRWAMLISDSSEQPKIFPFTSKGKQAEVLVEEKVADEDD